MPAIGTLADMRRTAISSVVKCGDTRITPRPPASAACAGCSRPSSFEAAIQRRQPAPPGAQELEQRNAQRIEAGMPAVARRSASDSSGKHSARLRAAMRPRDRMQHAHQRAEGPARAPRQPPRPARQRPADGDAEPGRPGPGNSNGGGGRGGGHGQILAVSAILRPCMKAPDQALCCAACTRWPCRICAADLALPPDLARPAPARILRSAGANASRSTTASGLDGCLWLHAVSVGEVNAAVPLVDGAAPRHPELALLVTTITPTGSERVRALWGDAVRARLPALRPARCRAPLPRPFPPARSRW